MPSDAERIDTDAMNRHIDRNNALASLYTVRVLIGLLGESDVTGAAEYVDWTQVGQKLERSEATLRLAHDRLTELEPLSAT